MEATLKRAGSLIVNVQDTGACLQGVVLLGECIGRSHEGPEAEAAANLLVGLLGRYGEVGVGERPAVVVATLLLKLTQYVKTPTSHSARRAELLARQLLSSVLMLMQDGEPPSVQAAAMDLVAWLCQLDPVSCAALDATDATVAIRHLDGGPEVRRAAVHVLRSLVGPAATDALREKRQSLLTANQLRPRLVALLRTEMDQKLLEEAALLLMTVASPSSQHSASASVGASGAGGGGVGTGPVRRKASSSVLHPDYDFTDFVALLSVAAPVALPACQALLSALLAGGEPAAHALRRQRGLERLVELLAAMEEPEMQSAAWAGDLRKSALSALEAMLKGDRLFSLGALVDCGGVGLLALLLASEERVCHAPASRMLELVLASGGREAALVERLLEGARPERMMNSVGGIGGSSTTSSSSSSSSSGGTGTMSGIAAAAASPRSVITVCQGVQNAAARALRTLESEGFTVREGLMALHAWVHWRSQKCPSPQDLRREVRMLREERARNEVQTSRLRHEREMIALAAESKREQLANEARIAAEAAEKSAMIRNEAEAARRRALVDVETEAARARAAALLDQELVLLKKRAEMERLESSKLMLEDAEMEMRRVRAELNQVRTELREAQEREEQHKDQIRTQLELIAQLSRVSEQLFMSEGASVKTIQSPIK